MKRKGIVLAGGSGTRLHPATLAVSKQLLPVYDKPMVYYPLTTLMLAGIREFLFVVTEDNLANFQRLFGNGENLGINIDFIVQDKPDGIAKGILLAENFLKDSKFALILLVYSELW